MTAKANLEFKFFKLYIDLNSQIMRPLNEERKRRILIVDDHPYNLQILSEALSTNGYTISFAMNGIQALTTLESNVPDLMLLDVMMPGMSGFELCEIIKQNELWADIPVIFMTAKTFQEDILTGFRYGAADYITKPFDAKEVIARVSVHVDLKIAHEKLKEELDTRVRTQKKLETAENRYRSVVEDMPALVCRYSPEGKITFVNRAFCEFFGKESDDLLCHDFYHFFDMQFNPTMFDENPENVFTFENQAVSSSQKPAFIRWTNRAIIDKNNHITEIQAIGIDIWERIVAEEKIRENQEKLRNFIDHSTDGILLANEKNEILEWNKGLEKISGYAKEEVLGKILFEVEAMLHKSNLKLLQSSVSMEMIVKDYRSLKSKTWQSRIVEQEIENKQGRKRFIQYSAFPIKTSMGIFFGAVVRDNTEKHENELALERYQNHLEDLVVQRTISLKRSEEKFRNIFESSNDGIHITDLTGKYLEFNERIVERSGFTREELLTMSVQDLPLVNDNETIINFLAEIHDKGEAIAEVEYWHKLGHIVNIEMNSKLVDYEGNKAILTISRDISERKQMQKKLVRAIYETEERERNYFAKELHDSLGALLSSINIYINLLRSNQFPEEEQKSILDNTKSIVDDAITSAREIANHLRPNVLTNYGLVPSLHSFCDKINRTGKLNISFRAENYKQVKDDNIELILFRVINEMINNTLKHANAKNITILLSSQNQLVNLNYCDDGIGFDVKKMIDNQGATGMGLRNIISRIHAINGKCDINSSFDEGTRVNIEITL